MVKVSSICCHPFRGWRIFCISLPLAGAQEPFSSSTTRRFWRSWAAISWSSPWHLRWDDENYYLIAYDAEADRVKHYRVDKMKRITLLEAPRLGQERMARFDPAVYTQRLFGMYGGQPVRVTLEGENEMVGVLIDRFGKEVPVLPVDGAHFQAFVDVAVSPQFLGWVAGLGGGLRIVSPEPVVQKMQALVQRLAEQYCAPDGDKTSV